MPFMSSYTFDNVKLDCKVPSPFTQVTMPFVPFNERWMANDNVLVFRREDNEDIHDLFSLVNHPDIVKPVHDQIEAASRDLPALFNFFSRPPLRASYVFAEEKYLIGPGGKYGGIPNIPGEVVGQM